VKFPPSSFRYVPSSHREQAVEPVAAAYVPAAHVVHDCELGASLNWPRRQSWQPSARLVLRKVPGSHSRVGSAVGAGVGESVGLSVGDLVGSGGGGGGGGRGGGGGGGVSDGGGGGGGGGSGEVVVVAIVVMVVMVVIVAMKLIVGAHTYYIHTMHQKCQWQ